MKRLTTFANLTTAEGERIAYTYSEIDESGEIISQNNKGNFVLLDKEMLEHLKILRAFIEERI